ncbi:MAG TPA: DUF6624 domain-containing protein [Patescibacteria group bacterium]|nr:DUF6624 domain-containing protein [Patescibacteria group bacterium]
METITPNPLSTELLEMSQADREMRTKAIKDMSLWDDSIDHRNTTRLKEIVAKTGWPTIPKVGAEASRAAWLLVQHAYADPEFMKECLALMKQADKGEVNPADVAFLEDRLLTMDEKPQIYGTQFRTIDGITEPLPMEYPEHVDERRASVGLGTFAENEARIKDMYG